ncbi:ABC transporter substrate-binding protein, partial [Achromobacter xylosoxidans]
MRQQFLRRAALGVSLALAGLAAQANDADGVKIGVLTDMAGVTADATGRGSVEAARLAIEELGGSVLGKPVALVSGDHQHRPDIGSGMVRKWYDTDGVDVVVDVPNSSVALAVQGIARE